MSIPHGPSYRPLLRGVSHQIALFVALGAATVLIRAAVSTTAVVAASIYGASLIAMFGASTALHRTRVPPDTEKWLERIDHSMIFLFIAGTATPFSLLHPTHAALLVAAFWAAAGLGVLRALFWIDAPSYIAVGLYLLVGWMGVFFMVPVWRTVGTTGFALLLGGGLLYTVGAIVYTLQRPNPLPKVFGFHEIFHAFVVFATACLYIPVTQAIVRLG